MLNFSRNMIEFFIQIKTFLFDNKSIKQTIAKNAFWLGAANIISRILTLFLFVYVARTLGAEEYGVFTFALAFIFLFSIFSDFGISQIATRELSRDKKREDEYPYLLSLKTLLISITLLIVFIGSFFITPDFAVRKVIWILALYVFTNSFAQIIYAFFQARQKMEYEAWAGILQAVLFTGFGFFVILKFPSALNLAFSYLAGTFVFISVLLLIFHLKFFKLRFFWDISVWRKFLSMSWPLALGGFFATIYSQIDSVMMGSLGQISETGWYNAALKIVSFTFLPAMLVSQSAYPALSIALKESKERLQKIWDYQTEIMVFFAVPLAVGGIILAPKIINFIYDASFAPAILAFQILIIMAGLVFLSSPLSILLIAANQQKKTFFISLIGAVVNIALNLVLIPRYSLYGAAFSTVITYCLIFFLLLRLVSLYTFLKPLSKRFFLSLIIASISSTIMYFFIVSYALYQLHVLFLVLIGAGVYFLFSFALRFFIKKL